MKTMRYIDGVATVKVDREICVGCSMCLSVCPHAVFVLDEKKVKLQDRNGCIECGACAMNCPVGAISVSPGVGCASLIISRWLARWGIESEGCC